MDRMNYWSNIGSDGEVALNAVRKITPREAVGFVLGCANVHKIVEEIDPDVIFIPERGAGPIDWVLQLLEESYSQDSRHRVYLPIGTCINPNTSEEWGPSQNAKRIIVNSTVEDLYRTGLNPKKPLLLDEVQSGATLTNVTHNLKRAIAEYDVTMQIANKLFVIAVQDTRNSWLTRKHAKGFKSIVEGRNNGVKAFIVEMPLFTTDRQMLLNRLFDIPDLDRMPMTEHNTDAIDFINGLVLTVIGMKYCIGSDEREVVNWGEEVIETVKKMQS